MNRTLKYISWVCLLICTLSLFPGIYNRVLAEQKNKNVIIAADYEEFAKQAGQAGLTQQDVLNLFKDNGIYSLIMKTPLDVKSTDMFAALSGNGFKLIPYLTAANDGTNSDLSLLSKLIQQFNIRYLFLDGSYKKSLSYYEGLSDIINQNHIVVGVFEAAAGLGITGQGNLEGVIAKTGYSIGRIYQVPDKDLKLLNSDELYLRYLRAIVDRNIRFVYLRPLTSEGSSLKETLNAVLRLKRYISSHGYEVGSDIEKLTVETSPLGSISIPFGIMAALFLLVLYLLEPKAKGLFAALFIILLTIGIPVFLLKSDAGGLTAFLAALVFPSLAITVMVKLLKTCLGKKFSLRLLTSLIVFLIINAAGACLIIASFLGIRYIMGLSGFPGPGVAVAYSVPLLAAFAAYCSYFKHFKNIVSDARQFNSNHGIAVKVLLIASTLFIFYYYLGRSGNGLGTGASKLEIHLREALEQFMMVRPRFKEILVGYPAFILLVLCVKKYSNKLILLPLVIAAAVSGVSLTNSFCHSYTPVDISFFRGLYGMLIGLVVGCVMCIVLVIFQKFNSEKRN